MKRLYRSRTDRKVAGLCAGIAAHFQVDPTIVRLLVVVVTVLTGGFGGSIAYLAAWFIVPEEPLEATPEVTHVRFGDDQAS